MRLLTPPGMAGVAVLSVEPAERAAVTACLRRPGGGVCAPAPGAPPQRASLCLDGRDVDDVLVVARKDGALEVHVHGAAAVLDQLDARFGLTVEPATAPVDRLLQQAMSPAQFDLAVEQRGFDFDAELAALAALPQAERAAGHRAALERSRVAMALTQPQPVALVGRQNAGKSTLFNLLLFRERALTGDTPGLTRDPVAERTTLGGYLYELIDTAGEGAAPTALDAAAIERGRARRTGAVVVAVVDGAVGPQPEDLELISQSALVVCSKQDLTQAAWPDGARRDASFSAISQPAEELRAAFGELLRTARALPPPAPVGGFAALDDEQLRRLQALDPVGPGGSGSA